MLTHHDESEAQRTKRLANKRKAMFHFNVELDRQADDKVHTIRELNIEKLWIIQERNTQHHAERRAEVMPEERNQA